MATGTLPSPPPKRSAPIQGRYEDFIQERLEQTRRQVRLVDFGSGIVLLLAASLFFFLLVALADHWLFAHGLNFFARLLLFGAWLATAGWFTWRAVAPSIIHRINPVFAAQAIEHGRPTLKNSLINFLLLRSHPENVAPVVYQAMEHRAATDLSRVPIDQAVDHRRFIHLCYALAAAVVVFALYLALSPKNPLVSAARVMFPFSSIAAPTRVHIEDLQPGDKIIYQGDRQEVSSHVLGLRDGEQVSLLMSTADGQVVDDRVTMNRVGEDDRYACELPPGSGGLLQTTSYRINAGDATTRPFKLEVEIAPTVNVDHVDYRFPAYTGIKDRGIKGQGDIKALEGTRVTIHATANVELTKAKIDLGCTGLRMIPMSLSGKQATGEFTLAGDQEPNKAWKPLSDRYQIILTDSEDHPLRQHPIQYRIDVDRDYPPELSIVEPKADTVDLAAGGHLQIRYRASDDFGLRHIAMKAERNGLPLVLPAVLDRVPPEKALAQPYDGELDFVATELHLMKGDEVKYWLEADDNKEPTHNHAETARRTIRIVDEQDAKRGPANPEKQDASKDDHGEDQPQGKSGSDTGAGRSDNPSHEDASKGETSPQSKGGRDGDPSKSKDPGKGDKSNTSKPEKSDNPGKGESSSEPKSGDSGTPESGNQGSKHTDSETQKADAMREIAKDMEKKEKQKKQPGSENSQPNQQQNQTQKGGNQDGNPQSADQSNDPNQSGQNSKTPQGGQGTKQSQSASPDKSQTGGASGDPQPNGNNQGAPSAKNAPSQDSKPGAENGGAQGKDKTSPPSGDNTQQPGGGTPPQGSPKPENPSGTGQSSPQSAGSQQGKDQSKSSAGPKKEGGSSGTENKQETKQPGGGKSPEQSASGGPKSDKKKATGGEQGGSEAGGSQAKSEKKSSSGQGGDNKNELAMKSGESPQKNPSQGGSSESRDTPGGSRPDKAPKPQSKSAGSGGESSQSQPKHENKEQSSGGGAGGKEQPKPGGEQPKPGGGKSSPSGTPDGKQGDMADGQPGQKDPSKSGETQQDSHGAPDPQGERQHGEPKSGDASESLSPKSDNPQSPSTSPHDSDSKGNTSGTNSGGGGAGGGQQNKKAGTGAAGTEKAANEGGSASKDKGGDVTGNKAGEGLRNTDNAASPRRDSGTGTGDKAGPKDKSAADDPQNKSDSTKPDNTAQNSSNTPQNAGGQSGAQSSPQPGQQGAGLPAGGSQAGNQPPAPPSKAAAEAKADEADQKFAKSQVDMALRHLKDETSKPKSDLLDRLGWTPEEAKKFAENIEKLRDSANQPGSEGDANKKAYSEFLKDLGLRPHGTRIEVGKTRADDFRGVRDAPQMDAPAEWEDIVRGYSQRTAAGQK